jgi:replication initiation protein RepC
MDMLGQNPTAPFGTGKLSLAVVRTQRDVKACPPGKPVHKWQVFRHICEARSQLGVSDRALAILNALLSFHPDTTLVSGAADLVVYPSNRQLALRAHGVAASTLRRHLASLVAAGLILRRDSPNGKRYARRGETGTVAQAFGFDLGSIVARADEFAHLADVIAVERQALVLLREQATLARRDIAKMIATGVEEGGGADWPTIHREFRNLVARLPRVPSREALEPLVRELRALAATVLEVLQRHVDQSKAPKAAADMGRADDSVASQSETASPPPITDKSNVKPQAATMVPVRFIVEACPDFLDYSRGEIRTARDVIATARLVRPLLGVSPSAWEEACAVMGEGRASIALAAILQRGAAIKNPGGYLRTLTRRASAGEFSVWPMVMALTASHHRRREAGGVQVTSGPFLSG